MEKEHILSPGDLLDKNGNLSEAGYCTSLIKKYDRKSIKASSLRIKEWDYYFVSKGDLGVALTVADNSYMCLLSVSVMNFRGHSYKTQSKMKFFTMGRVGLPSSSAVGDVSYSVSGVNMKFENDGKTRHLSVFYPDFEREGEHFTCDLRLTDEPRDSMVIATPFARRRHFYYNQKINCMSVRGSFSVDGEVYNMDGGMGTLDWGRGVWTYKNTWYWSSLSCVVDDEHKFGFNLGYGFGDTSAATENMLFYDGVAHKLGRVTFDIPKDEKGKENYMGEWRLRTDDGRLDMRMLPICDRKDHAGAVIIDSDQHQVFGRMYGTAVLDDGRAVELHGQIGFAEKVKNRW